MKKVTSPTNIQEIAPTLIRNIRQVVIGPIIAVVGVLTSLVSIFTSKELMNMSSSEDTDDELIDNRNNIIKTLQSHESAIHRDEAAIKEAKIQIDKPKTQYP